MELQCPSFQVLFTLFLLVITVLMTLGKKAKTKNSSNLPPGPWKLPIIGNIHQLIGSLPHHRLRDLAKKHGQLMHLRLGEVSTVVVSSAEFAKEVMKTHDIIFASRPEILAAKILAYDSTSIASSPYGDYWKLLRKICTQELMSAKRVLSFRPIREKEVLNLINWIGSRAESPVNITEKLYSLSCSITSQAAFGKKSRDRESFLNFAKEMVKLAGGFALADAFPSIKLLYVMSGMRLKLEKLHKEGDRIMENIIREHIHDTATTESKEDKVGEDLVDVLLKFHNIGGGHEFSLTTDNIKAVIFDIFSAGSDTSASTVNWAITEMMKHPRIMKRAQDEVREVFNRKGEVTETVITEMKYLNSIIKETLRLHPPAPLLLPRVSRERCEIDGYEIPTKTKVIVNAWAVNRDPKFWTEPEMFFPERFLDSSVNFKGRNFEFIPFGAGRRMCPGMAFGMANMEFPLASLLYHFDWRLPNGMKHEELDMTELFGATVCRKENLYLIPTPYHPLPLPTGKTHV